MVAVRWVHPTLRKYFEAVVETDLFGDLVFITHEGGEQKNSDKEKKTAIDSYEVAQEWIKQIHKRRLSHGYELQPTML
jgi:hypothetical protein